MARLIGVDFDNTIVAYDDVIRAEAVGRGLVPDVVATSKEAVRNHLRALGREEDWTRLQGFVYGPGMRAAKPFPGALEFFERCRVAGVTAVIISHRTRRPYLGDPHDLHAYARWWLAHHGVAAAAYFETTLADKLARIGAVGCTHFVDDLPEFLAEEAFPAGVVPVLFDPHCSLAADSLPARVHRAVSWDEIAVLLVET